MGWGDATSITWDNLHDVTAYCPRASPCPDVTQLCHHATPALRSGGRGGGGACYHSPSPSTALWCWKGGRGVARLRDHCMVRRGSRDSGVMSAPTMIEGFLCHFVPVIPSPVARSQF